MDGLFRLAPEVRCSGDVHAPAGVVVGRCSVVEGDVFTDGPVEIEEGGRIEGEIRPTLADASGARQPETDEPTDRQSPTRIEVGSAQDPSREPPPTSSVAAQVERELDQARSESELEAAALQSTLQVFFDLARDFGTSPRSDEPVWGLTSEALEDMLKGSLVLVADVHLPQLPEPPWPRDIVREVLLGRALASVVDVSVEAAGPDRFVLQVRPPRSWSGDDAETDWPTIAASVVRHLGQAARPSLEVEILEGEGTHDEARLVVDF